MFNYPTRRTRVSGLLDSIFYYNVGLCCFIVYMFLSTSVTLLYYLQLLLCHVICIVLLIFVEDFVILINKYIFKYIIFLLKFINIVIQ